MAEKQGEATQSKRREDDSDLLLKRREDSRTQYPTAASSFSFSLGFRVLCFFNFYFLFFSKSLIYFSNQTDVVEGFYVFVMSLPDPINTRIKSSRPHQLQMGSFAISFVLQNKNKNKYLQKKKSTKISKISNGF